MKKILTLMFILLSIVGFTQESNSIATTSTLGKNVKYQAYITESGDTIRVGDIIKIGKPSGDKTFNYIMQGGQYCMPFMAGKKIIIEKIWSLSYNKKTQPTLFICFGRGLAMIWIDYENAILEGEVVKI
jgi:hypothetical protein